MLTATTFDTITLSPLQSRRLDELFRGAEDGPRDYTWCYDRDAQPCATKARDTDGDPETGPQPPEVLRWTDNDWLVQ